MGMTLIMMLRNQQEYLTNKGLLREMERTLPVEALKMGSGGSSNVGEHHGTLRFIKHKINFYKLTTRGYSPGVYISFVHQGFFGILCTFLKFSLAQPFPEDGTGFNIS